MRQDRVQGSLLAFEQRTPQLAAQLGNQAFVRRAHIGIHMGRADADIEHQMITVSLMDGFRIMTDFRQGVRIIHVRGLLGQADGYPVGP